MIACNHDGTDACLTGCLDSRFCFWTGGIKDADQTEQIQFALDLRLHCGRNGIQRTIGYTEDAQPLRGHIINVLIPDFAALRRQFYRAFWPMFKLRPLDQTIRRTFGDRDVLALEQCIGMDRYS